MCIRINDTCQGINTVFEQSDKFYVALRHIPTRNTEYFTKDVQLYPGAERCAESTGLEPLSVAVVFSFGFRAREIDPLDSVNVRALFKICVEAYPASPIPAQPRSQFAEFCTTPLLSSVWNHAR